MVNKSRGPEPGNGYILRFFSLKNSDVRVYSRMYDKSDEQAVRDLTELRVPGHEIGWKRGSGFGGDIRLSRSKAAMEFFRENIGEPTVKLKRKKGK